MRKLTLAVAATALLATAPAASAAEYDVTGGSLEWTIANQYTGGGDAARTWLGYATNSVPVAGPAANGKVEPTAPATLTGPAGPLTIVDGTSPRGVDKLYTLGYPVAAQNAGTYSDIGVGTVELKGTFTFTIHPTTPAIKPITITDPLITLNGLTGTLKSSGKKSDGADYDRTLTQFTLDLSKSDVILRADGSRVIRNIIPKSNATTVLSGFQNQERFGTMCLVVGLENPTPPAAGGAFCQAERGPQGAPGEDGQDGEQGPQGEQGLTPLASPGAQGPQGPAGPAGPAGPRGAAGKSAKISSFTLKSAPFSGSAKRNVRLLQRKTGKLLATGTLQGRKLRLSHLETTKLKGSYVVRLTNGKRRATVTLR